MTRRRFLILALILVLLPVLGYVAANAWLESAGGRKAIEMALAEATGMQVELTGDFDIVLLPAPGVGGTGLVIHGEQAGLPFISNTNYQLELALRPLLKKQLLIESVRIDGGTVAPEYFSRKAGRKAGKPDGRAYLPEIERFVLEDFEIRWPGEGSGFLMVRRLVFSEFAADMPTPFMLDTDSLGRLEGDLTWWNKEQKLALAADWSGTDIGTARGNVTLLLTDLSGTVDIQYLAPAANEAVTVHARFRDAPRGVQFPEIWLALADQSIAGQGCLLRPEAELNLSLEAARLDLEAWQEILPDLPGGGGDGDLPLAFNILLAAGQVISHGAVAKRVTLRAGKAPACDF